MRVTVRLAVTLCFFLVAALGYFYRQQTNIPVAVTVDSQPFRGGQQVLAPISTISTAPASETAARPTKLAAGDEETTPSLPPSLQGTEVDGQLAMDDNSQLLVTRDLLRVYDYFLSMLGELDEVSVTYQLQQYITANLSPDAAEQAMDLFDRYLQYKEALAEWHQAQAGQPAMHLEDPAHFGRQLIAQQQAIALLRQRVLGIDVAQAFFADEERFDRFHANQLQQLALTNKRSDKRPDAGSDTGLDTGLDTKAATDVPQAWLLRRQKSQRLQQIHDSTNQYDKLADADKIYAMRAEAFDIDYAERMRLVDQEEVRWSTRVDDYQQQRDAIVAQAGISNSDKEVQIASLQQRLFSAAEQKRVLAMESSLP